VDGSRILLFGSSGGGLPAFETAKRINNCTVMVFNIQVNASKHPGFKEMYDKMFPGLTPEKLFQTYRARFFLPDILDGSGLFLFYFLQNLADHRHFNKHYSIFKEWFLEKKIKGSLGCLGGKFFVYEDEVSGHGSIGKEAEVSLIDKHFSGHDINL